MVLQAQDNSVLRAFCVVFVIGVIVSAVCLAPGGLGPEAGFTPMVLTHLVVATLSLGILFLSPRAPNCAANHGAMGLFVGFVLGSVFCVNFKARIIYVLLIVMGGAFCGLVIGLARRGLAEKEPGASLGDETGLVDGSASEAGSGAFGEHDGLARKDHADRRP